MNMAPSQEDIQKIFIGPNGVAIIKCPNCDAGKTVKVDKFKGAKHVLNIKCNCQKVFQVNLEFRKFYRKSAVLSGEYVLLPEKIHKGRMIVVNVSKGGVGLRVIDAHRLVPGQEIQIRFTLDDKRHSLIDRRVVIRLVNKKVVNCEFVDSSPPQDKALGFYLMV